MTKCKHNRWKDYVWRRDRFDHETDELLYIYCHQCGAQLK